MDILSKVPYGALDIAARELEDAQKEFTAVLAAGHHRMRKEDVERMRKYLKRIAAAEKSIKATLKEFEILVTK